MSIGPLVFVQQPLVMHVAIVCILILRMFVVFMMYAALYLHEYIHKQSVA